MIKKRYVLAAVAAGLALPVLATTSAQAHVKDAYLGNRGHAWTNTAHTRVGVEDQRSDRVRIYVEAWTEDGGYLLAPDVNDSNPGHSAYPSPDGSEFSIFRVWGYHLDEHRWLPPGNLVEIS